MAEPNARSSSGGARLYEKYVLAAPAFYLTLAVALTLFFGWQLQHFRLDASSDSIVLENDKDLLYYNYTRDVFGSDDYVVITVTPREELLSDHNLDTLRSMVDEFEAMDSVDSVVSVLSVPLFHSPPVPLLNIATGYKTLESPGVRKDLAFPEFVQSPLYQDYLVSVDGKTMAVQVNFKPPEGEYREVIDARRELRDRRRESGLSSAEKERLEGLEERYNELYAASVVQRRKDIAHIRDIVAKYEPKFGEMHIGGVPMIMADIIAYVANDIQVFAGGVLALVLLTLAIVFRKVKWVLLPTAACIMTVIIMLGYMGFVDWPATIVTSNFPSLLIVVTLALGIHIAVRYRELYAEHPDWENKTLVREAVRLLAIPCLYTSLTTIVGFGSLMVSGIRPVIDFGVMMSAGLAVAYGLTFVVIPCALLFFPKGNRLDPSMADTQRSPMRVFARVTERKGRWIAAGSLVLFVVCVLGIQRLKVENRFIDYFDEETEIYQGMMEIDERIGGTTPLEVVLEGEGKNYWLQEENLANLRRVHEWLDALPETGKTISPDTMVRILEKMNNGQPVPVPFINMGLSQVPPEIERAAIGPYVSPDRDMVRIAMRVRETDRSLNRKELIEKMRNYLQNEAELGEAEAHITGIFVLYNNMLQSLYRSQIVTLGVVFGAIWVMFLLLFRSPTLATIAIIPNILPVALVLGTLGWSGIPLDIMTIMISSITMGLAVDFAIHYIHRFKMEFPKDRDYIAAMYRCHNSIGRAILYTTITTVAGFSILTLSNFNPTIYFGIFTSLALIVAFLASVTLLPFLIVRLKPLGKPGA